MITDIMIDLETLGEHADSAIIQIGACAWDENVAIESYDQLAAAGQTFSRNVNLQSSIDSGMIVGGDTFYWWLRQTPEARESLQDNREPLLVVLSNFVWWMQRMDPDIGVNLPFRGRVWAWPSQFDLPIMHTAYRRVRGHSARLPWHRRKERDARTYCVARGRDEMQGAPKLLGGVEHVAVYDAVAQAMEVQHYMRIRE